MGVKAPSVRLVEEEPCLVATGLLGEAAASRLHQQYRHLVALESPNPEHPGHYVLRSRGWVGHLDLGGLQLELVPKIPLDHLFAMVEQAYGLGGVNWPPGMVRSGSLAGSFAFLAGALVRLAARRLRQGLYREYQARDAILGSVRGQPLFPPGRHPGRVRCAFHERSADTTDNQLLLAALDELRRRDLADPALRGQVKQLCHQFAGQVRLRRFHAEEYLDRSYHRLNRDYAILHALCFFFLDHRVPGSGGGRHPMPPFAVHLPTLFERFVARWLARRLPAPGHLEVQHRALLEGGGGMAFQVDLVLRAGDRGRPLAVLDTKYKRASEPLGEDLQQVVAYAVRMGTPNAFLVYPSAATTARRIRVGGVVVDVVSFALDGDLDHAGSKVLAAMAAVINRINKNMSINKEPAPRIIKRAPGSTRARR